jgi:hypothetical protein
MTDNKSTRPTSNILNNNEESEIKSSRPQSNIEISLQASNESTSFDFITVSVCDEKSVPNEKGSK